MQKAAVIIFDKFEELEAVAPADILRRAGIETSLLTLSSLLTTTGRNGIAVCADAFLSDRLDNTYDALVICGGPGVAEAAMSHDLLKMVKRHGAEEKIVAAICAAPTILKKAGVLGDKKFTAHTSVLSQFTRAPENAEVVVSGNIITSRGAGTAVAFGLEIVRALKGDSVEKEIANSICYANTKAADNA